MTMGAGGTGGFSTENDAGTNITDAPANQPATGSDGAAEGGTPIDVPPDHAAAAADFFQLSMVHRVEITIDPAQWQGFMQEHANTLAVPQWRQADFKIDGVPLTKVGFKTFGFGSRLSAPNKPNLNLDLKKYVAGQNFNGVSRMRIKNNGQDPSGLREAISYEAMRTAGLGAARSTWAELSVNGEPYGFYSVEEAFTSSFVFERTGNENGTAYEADDCQGFVAPTIGGCAKILDFYQRAFNPLVGAGEDLVALCTAMNGPADQFVSSVSPLIDLDQWITAVAAATALAGDYDGFSTNGNNFRMYHDTATNKMLLFIFGPDVTYDVDYLPFPDPLDPKPGADCAMRNPMYHDIFLEKLRGTPEGLARYTAAVKKLRMGPMSPTMVKQRVDALWTTVGAWVKADPRRAMTPDPEVSKDQIKDYIDMRVTALEGAGL